MKESVALAERLRTSILSVPVLCCLLAQPAWSSGTAAGTVVDNIATIDFDLAGVSGTLDSNNASFSVLERVDIVTTLQSGQVIVAPSQADAALLFRVTNNGNGSDTLSLAVDSTLTGDDFDPLPATPAIYFDSDSSGDFSAGDVARTDPTSQPGPAPPSPVAAAARRTRIHRPSGRYR